MKKILIRVPNWIGDAVMSLPAITAIGNSFKNAEIFILARSWVSPIYINNPYVDRIVEYRSGDIHKGIMGRMKLIGEMKKEGFDAAFLLQNAFDAALIAFLARIPIRVGYATDLRGFLLTHPIKNPGKKRMHHMHYYLEMLRKSNIVDVTNCNYPAIHLMEEEYRWADQFLSMNGIDTEKSVIGINPGASYGPAKRWFPERFAGAAEELSQILNASVILFGSKEDGEVCRKISENLRCRNIDLSGKTNLRELISIISRCTLFITNDTGPMHIASALNIPVVAIFGSTDPDLTAPVGNHVSIVRKKVECAPCFERYCRRNFECMDNINVSDVVKASLSLLQNAK